MKIPKLNQSLTQKHIDFLKNFATSCRKTIIEMLKNSQSGHPGGSLSCIDYLTTLYAYHLAQSGEPIIISNGHISPAVYAILAELNYIPKKNVIKGFRKIGYPYEGHVSRLVPGVWYGTGPLGTGISAATGFALAQKLNQSIKDPLSISPPTKGTQGGVLSSHEKVYALIGDGESEEGQVYEMMNFASKYKLDNLIVFMDYNKVQLSDSLEKIMPLDPKKIFKSGGWEVIEVDGHDYQKIWQALGKAHKVKDKPILLLGKTIMGKGVSFMEQSGKNHEAKWHGKAPSESEANQALEELTLKKDYKKMFSDFEKNILTKPKKPYFPKSLSKIKIKIGKPRVYTANELTDCRTAYGNALLDLSRANSNIIALTADLAESVKTSIMKEEFPDRHIECGIAEQHMLSCSGGLSLAGYIPFCSTFGAFMTSRAKDQARVNDINHTNVKMVATHCGLSVGEDGPTHQAIDDMGSMIGLFNTMVIEPADPNHTDRIIRFIASHYGNFYVRMGRHKIPVLTREDGSIFFDKDYTYSYGRCDVLREGNDITVIASGSVVCEALKAREEIMKKNKKASVEIVIASSLKKFDDTLMRSIQKTKNVLVVEDHNSASGLASQISRFLIENKLSIQKFKTLGVNEYQLSGTAEDLYAAARIDASAIAKAIGEM